MKQPVAACTLCILVLSALSSGCATRPAPGISGRWTAVAQYPASPDELPLSRPYVFQASPVDRTLKAMLTRWARESKTSLAYRHPSDFTLYAPVAEIRTRDLRDAAAKVSSLYAAQHVLVTVHGDTITVCRTDLCAIEIPRENVAPTVESMHGALPAGTSGDLARGTSGPPQTSVQPR